MPFGQAIIGPPGSGKTTFCLAAATLMRSTGRAVCVVNLDPANDELPYECDVDVADLVSLEAVQDATGLGPNGGLAYCMDYLLKNFDWLEEQLARHTGANEYVIFDCPGQSELYMCHDAFQRIVGLLAKQLHFNLTAVQLVDSHLCVTPHKYLAALLTSLTSMLHLELPHVNVLSKADLLEKLTDSEVVIAEQLTDIDNLRHQLEAAPSAFATRFAGLSTGLCDVLENYGLISLVPVAVEQPETLANVMDLIDRANGFNLSGLQGHNPYPDAQSEDTSRLKEYLSAGPQDIWSGAGADSAEVADIATKQTAT